MDKRPTHAELAISPNMPAGVVRQEFARRLQRAMIEKGWTQSELARQASRFTPDGRIIRDSVSKYIRGKVLPGPLHLSALSKALAKKPDELLPTRGTSDAGADHPPMDIRDLRDGNAWVRINQAVPWDTAMQIAQLIHGK